MIPARLVTRRVCCADCARPLVVALERGVRLCDVVLCEPCVQARVADVIAERPDPAAETQCPRGHARTPENLTDSGRCRACQRATWHAWTRKKKENVP
jgi:hypothetical protein